MKLTKTITSIFMVPTLNIPKDSLKDNGFINGYSYDKLNDNNCYENSIYILFKPNCLDKFRDFLDKEYDRTKQIIDDYDYKGGYVIVIYKLEDKLNEDFNLIRKGKYSKTSDEFKKIFPKNITIKYPNGFYKNEVSLQYRIFNKTEDLIEFWEDKLGITFNKEELEVWEGFDEERETLTINKLN